MERVGAKSTTLPGFVSTSLLTSSDGLFGDNVEEQRIAATPAPQNNLDSKPLYERLQEIKERKEREWKEKNNPFAPPKGLDDDEVNFLRDVESQKADAEKQRRSQQQEDIADFILARKLGHAAVPKNPAEAAVSNATIKQPDVKKRHNITPSIVVRSKKRSADPESTTAKKSKNSEKMVTVKSTTVASGNGIVGGLVGYGGSDSDSS